MTEIFNCDFPFSFFIAFYIQNLRLHLEFGLANKEFFREILHVIT